MGVLSFSGKISSSDKLSGTVAAKLRFKAFGIDSGLMSPSLTIDDGLPSALFAKFKEKSTNLDNLPADVLKEVQKATSFDLGVIDDIIECIVAAINGDFDGVCKKLKEDLVKSAEDTFANSGDAAPPSNARRNMCKKWHTGIKELLEDYTMSGGIKNVLRLKEMQDGRTPKKETVSGDVAKKTAQTMVGHLNVMELVEEVHGQNQ